MDLGLSAVPDVTSASYSLASYSLASALGIFRNLKAQTLKPVWLGHGYMPAHARTNANTPYRLVTKYLQHRVKALVLVVLPYASMQTHAAYANRQMCTCTDVYVYRYICTCICLCMCLCRGSYREKDRQK